MELQHNYDFRRNKLYVIISDKSFQLKKDDYSTLIKLDLLIVAVNGCTSDR
jgi:hypothetical protein